MPVTAFAPKTCLQIANAALGELGFPQLTLLNANPDPTAVQVLALLNEEGEELRDTAEGGWTAMQAEFNLIVNPPVITAGDVTLDSPIIQNIASTAGLTAGNYAVISNSLPTAARILSVDSLTQVTMTMEATGTVVQTPVTFAPDTYALPP